MRTKSNAKLKPAPLPPPVKTPKTRISKDMREALHRYMVEEFRRRLDKTEIENTRIALVERTNAILRAKYPEEDMPVLRKYDMNRVDACLKFTVLDTGRVFQVSFNHSYSDLGAAALVDIPCVRGCYNHEIYACDKEFEVLADSFEKQIDDRHAIVAGKEREYKSFLAACRYLEEVEAVVPLTEEIRDQVGAQSRSLTLISPAVLSSIKSDFAQEAA